MAVRCVLFCMLLAAVPAVHGQPMFEGASSFGDEELKGKPKLVKVEREKLDAESLRLPEEERAYRADGQLSSRQRFHDGKPLAIDTFEYDSKGQRTAVTSRDKDDKVVRAQTFHHLEDGSEEEIDVAGGKQQNRTIRRFDTKRRVVELTSTDMDSVSTIMQFEYDRDGRPLEARVRMEGGNLVALERGPNGGRHASSKDASGLMMRVRIVYPGDNQANITMYDGGGNILLQLQTTEDNAGNQMDQVLFEKDPHDKPANSTRIEHTDDQGNWTLKTLLERNPKTQVDEPVARLHRSILYY
jgi:hypothetical protein